MPYNSNSPPPLTTRPRNSTKPWRSSPKCETSSRTSTISFDRSTAISTGKSTCYDIPVCFALRNTFEALDSIDQLTEKFDDLVTSLDKLDAIQPQLVGLIPPQIASQEVNQELVLKTSPPTPGSPISRPPRTTIQPRWGKLSTKPERRFVLLTAGSVQQSGLQSRPETISSPDGKAARMIITHEGDPAEPAAISHVEPIKLAAHESGEEHSVGGRQLLLGGTASTYKDIQDMANYDLLIVAIASLSLILLIMMIITAKPGRGDRDRAARWRCRWALRSVFPCCCGSTSSASDCIGSYWLWPSSCCWPSVPTTICC